MIRPRFVLKLANTKLRTKRGMLIASILAASLLYAALIATIIVFTGAEKSSSDFIRHAGNDRYLVKVTPYIPNSATGFSQELSLEEIREIRAYEKKFYDERKATYKSLGIEYDSTAEISVLQPAAWKSASLPEEQRVMVNWDSPATNALLEEKFARYQQTATNKFSDLQKLGAKYHATGYYLMRPSSLPSIPGQRLLVDGKENFGDSEPKSGDMSFFGSYTNAIHNGGYEFVDQRLLERYTVKDIGGLKGIPVVVSAQEASALFGKKLGIAAEPNDERSRIAWLRDVQQKTAGHTYHTCYRNSAEQALLSKIQRDYAEMKANEKIPDYQKPSLLYDYPTEPCGDIIVKSDTRSAQQKRDDAKADDVAKKLGTYVAPAHRTLTFQIVGVVYAQPYADVTKSADEYLKNLLSPPRSSMNIEIPLQLYDTLPPEQKLVSLESASTTSDAQSSDEFATRVLEFATISDARSFLDAESCSQMSTNCAKQFLAEPYGSNYLILDDISALLQRITTIAFPVIFGLAALIVWLTVSRIMAENRKETAVYRAMGARRSDVASIYFVYTILVGFWIALVSFVLGLALAWGIDMVYGQKLSAIAVTSFGIVDAAPKFSLFSLASPLIPAVVLSVFVVSVAASLQPLVRGSRRNPINDMRIDG